MKSENEVDLSDEVKGFIKDVEKYDFIRLSLPDINGIHLSKLLPTRFAKKLAMGQVEMYSGSIAFGPRFEVSEDKSRFLLKIHASYVYTI